MLIFAFHISLIIVAIHALFWEGMILFPVGRILNYLPLLIKKPLFQCMICMSSIWTLIIAYCYHVPIFRPQIIILMLTVCGINVIIDSIIGYLRDH
jgi:hypothetical protein